MIGFWFLFLNKLKTPKNVFKFAKKRSKSDIVARLSNMLNNHLYFSSGSRMFMLPRQLSECLYKLDNSLKIPSRTTGINIDATAFDHFFILFGWKNSFLLAFSYEKCFSLFAFVILISSLSSTPYIIQLFQSQVVLIPVIILKIHQSCLHKPSPSIKSSIVFKFIANSLKTRKVFLQVPINKQRQAHHKIFFFLLFSSSMMNFINN